MEISEEEYKRLKEFENALTDAAVVSWVLSEKNANNPRKMISDLLLMEARTALDPAVSEDAAKLHEQISELEAETELFSDCLRRATVLWVKEHPEADYWPDGAVNLAWILEKIAELEEKK